MGVAIQCSVERVKGESQVGEGRGEVQCFFFFLPPFRIIVLFLSSYIKRYVGIHGYTHLSRQSWDFWPAWEIQRGMKEWG